jgi:hypothetical protein
MGKALIDRANKSVIQSGAGVPGESTRGNIYFDTDTSTLYLRTAPGEAWTEITGGGGDSFWVRDEGDASLTPATSTDTVLVEKIGSGVSVVDSSAVAEFTSTTKGILPPRMTTAQRNNIATPATGLQIFNVTTGKENIFNGSGWEELTGGDVSAWSGVTTTGSVTELFLGGIISTRYTLQSNSTSVFELLCIARDGTNNKSKAWKIQAVAQSSSFGISDLVGTPTYTVIAQSDLSGGTDDWDISIGVWDLDETVRLYATGAAGITISWSVRG